MESYSEVKDYTLIDDWDTTPKPIESSKVPTKETLTTSIPIPRVSVLRTRLLDLIQADGELTRYRPDLIAGLTGDPDIAIEGVCPRMINKADCLRLIKAIEANDLTQLALWIRKGKRMSLTYGLKD